MRNEHRVQWRQMAQHSGYRVIRMAGAKGMGAASRVQTSITTAAQLRAHNTPPWNESAL